MGENMKIIAITLFLIQSKSLLAAGGGVHGSPSDLIWPAINFIALFSFLAIKLRKPLTQMFDKQAKDVQETYELAEKKDKEAQIKLETFQKKMAGFEREKQRVIEESEKEGQQLAQTIEKDTALTLEKLKIDAESKLSYEREQLMRQLNEGLVDEVVKRAREKIGGSKDYQNKVTEKLIGQVGR
jgi:F-type H+-transporting ATPase subunit b